MLNNIMNKTAVPIQSYLLHSNTIIQVSVFQYNHWDNFLTSNDLHLCRTKYFSRFTQVIVLIFPSMTKGYLDMKSMFHSYFDTDATPETFIKTFTIQSINPNDKRTFKPVL